MLGVPEIEVAATSDGNPDDVRYALETSNASGSDPRLNRDDWLVHRLVLQERLSEPYSIWVTAATGNTDLDVQGLLGADVRLALNRGGLLREFVGLITCVEDGGVYQQLLGFRVLVVPAFSLLQQRINTRIFQAQTAVQIVETVLNEGLTPHNRTIDIDSLKQDYLEREYCVQYQESDFDFCCRLMEEEGIAFHFSHEGAHEVLTLTDTNASFLSVATREQPQPRPGAGLVAQVPFILLGGSVAPGESVCELTRAKRVISTGVWVRDFDWSAPDRPIDSRVEMEGGNPREHYDHGHELTIGHYEAGARRYTSGQRAAQHQAEIRRTRQRLEDTVAHGAGYATGFAPGRTFELTNHPQPDMNREYLLVGVTHHKDTSPDGATDSAAQARSYMNVFECVAKDQVYVPSRWTRKPRIYGAQTARVCGPDPNQPHTDEHGRIKLHFHWDRFDLENGFESENTCWVRVSQPMAGPGWGHQFIPHPGMEVVVTFMDGDPDRPLVVGTVYNGSNTSPFPTPDQALNSGFRTVRGNELRMTDVPDREEVYLHAERDFSELVEKQHKTTVKASQRNTVYGSQSESVGGNQSLTVHHDRTKTVKGNENVTIEVDREKTVQGNETIHVEMDRTETVVGNENVTIQGTRTSTVEGSDRVTLNAGREVFVESSDALSVNGDKIEEISNNYSINAQSMFTVSQGDTSLTLHANQAILDARSKIHVGNAGGRIVVAPGGTINVAANSELVLMCGQSSIVLKPDSVVVSIGTSAIELKPAEMKLSGTKVTAEGTAELTLIGAQVKGN